MNELTLAINMVFQKGGAQDSINSTSVSINVAGSKYIKAVKTIGTIATQVDLSSLTTPGYCVIHNLDSTNFVRFSPDGTNHFAKVKAGEWGTFRLAGSTLWGLANTAPCNVEIFVVED